MRRELAPLRRVVAEAALHDGTPRAGCDQAVGLNGDALAAPEARTVARADLAAAGYGAAFCAVASACATKGLARWASEERMLPGRMRKSSSPPMGNAPRIAPSP